MTPVETTLRGVANRERVARFEQKIQTTLVTCLPIFGPAES